MVVEMQKLCLVAMAYDKNALLNALAKTGAAEVKAETPIVNEGGDEYLTVSSRLECALEVLMQADKEANRQKKSAEIELTYSDFLRAEEKKSEVLSVLERVESLKKSEREYISSISKSNSLLAAAKIYSELEMPLTTKSTKHVSFLLGTMPKSAYGEFLKSDEYDEAEFKELACDGENTLLFCAVHKCALSETSAALRESGFVPCPFDTFKTGKEFYKELISKRTEQEENLKGIQSEIIALIPEIPNLKIYYDFVRYLMEKEGLSANFKRTVSTFFLQAYVPKGMEDKVSKELQSVTSALYIEFVEPGEDETPPTLLKNNKAVQNFEAITDMYSPVSYKEFDPNAIMAVFYSLFLGFIMADIGYGILMTVLGGAMYYKCKRPSGIKKLSGVFAIGGIFAIVWGFLFNSFFGIKLNFISSVLPDAQKDMWKLLGVKVPSVLIISMLLGLVQLFAGYICRTVQCFRRKKFAIGINGLFWAMFTLGAALTISGMVEEFGVSTLTTVGGITAGVFLLLAVISAGHGEKLFKRFTKGFGAAYSVINFASDVLSYARLYGLMLSGAVIAQIVSSYSVDFILSGNAVWIIIGLLLLLIGHAFNLAIGLLGAYIHDARLQYVEFYGRFYEGEGEPFKPLGSTHKYIYVSN